MWLIFELLIVFIILFIIVSFTCFILYLSCELTQKLVLKYIEKRKNNDYCAKKKTNYKGKGDILL
jgi:hypothetical protein